MKGFHLGFDQILTTFKGIGTGSGKFWSDTRNGQRGISKEDDNFSRKFAHGPRRSISISTEISRNLGIMESILSVFQVTI